MKSGRQRREEIKGQRNSETQSATRRKQSRARRRVPWETCRWTSRLSRRTRATARLRLLCAAIIRTLLFVVVAVAKRRSGQRTQQKWWYEVAKGYVYSNAKFCRPCRKRERARREEARRVYFEGIGRKRQKEQQRFPIARSAMFCPQCKDEYREGFTECADCQIPLVSELPLSESNDEQKAVDLVEVLSTADPGLIALVKSVLEAEEILYLAHGEHFSRMHATIPVKFLVSKEDVELAREVLKAVL